MRKIKQTAVSVCEDNYRKNYNDNKMLLDTDEDRMESGKWIACKYNKISYV